MGLLTADMKRVVGEQRLGFVATVCPAVEEARRLSSLPAFGRVMQQLRGGTVEQLSRIVERDEEPLLLNWV